MDRKDWNNGYYRIWVLMTNFNTSMSVQRRDYSTSLIFSDQNPIIFIVVKDKTKQTLLDWVNFRFIEFVSHSWRLFNPKIWFPSYNTFWYFDQMHACVCIARQICILLSYYCTEKSALSWMGFWMRIYYWKLKMHFIHYIFCIRFFIFYYIQFETLSCRASNVHNELQFFFSFVFMYRISNVRIHPCSCVWVHECVEMSAVDWMNRRYFWSIRHFKTTHVFSILVWYWYAGVAAIGLLARNKTACICETWSTSSEKYGPLRTLSVIIA